MPLGQYISSFSPLEGILGIYGGRQGGGSIDGSACSDLAADVLKAMSALEYLVDD
jgi:hypothetical protein